MWPSQPGMILFLILSAFFEKINSLRSSAQSNPGRTGSATRDARPGVLPFSGLYQLRKNDPRNHTKRKFVCIRVISWIVPLFRKENTKPNEATTRLVIDTSHLPPTATIRSINFGSSGSKPDLGRRGVSSIQFRSMAKTRLKSGSDSSTRPMFTNATACQ